MPINVTCASCGTTLKTPDSSAGKSGKCPKCSSPIKIPAIGAEEEILDAEDSLFDGLEKDVPTTAGDSKDERKPCPVCGEMIIRDAVKCRFCGEIFDPLLKEQEQKQLKKASAGEDDKLSVGEWVLAILCSGIGCIVGIIWIIQGKPKGKKLLTVSIAVWFIYVILQILLAVAMEANQ